MNVIVLHDFEPGILADLQARMKDARITQYAHIERVPPAEMAAADILFTARGLPDPADAPALRWVQCNSAGVDAIIGHPLFHTGRVALTTAAGVHATNMAEHALMMMLALGHNLPMAFDMMRRGTWARNRADFTADELDSATVGIIGYGHLGRAIAVRCRALGMRVLATASRQGGDDTGVQFVPRNDLDALLCSADYVVLTAPLTPQTRHLIDANALGRMKRSARLINIARGAIVDEPALVDALRAGTIAGAALDVFEREPLPDDSPLWTLSNVILTPHVSGPTRHYQRRAADIFAGNYARFRAGQPLQNRVDVDRGY